VSDINFQINKNKISCLIFLVMGMIYVSPVILADRYYVDDLNRAVLGYTWWALNGRPLADVVMSALSFSSSISDVSPLTQILGVSSMMVVPYYLHKIAKLESVFLSVLISLLIITCPLFLETISYSFDSLTMMLSVAFMFLPFCIKLDEYKIRFIVSVVCVVCSLSLYQASLSIFVALALVEFSRRDAYIKSFITLLIDAVAFLLANAAYKIFIADRFVKGSYSINKAKIIDFKAEGSFELLSKHIETFYNYTLMALGRTYILLLITLLLVFVAYQSVIFLKSLKTSSYVVALKSFIVLNSPIIIAAGIYLPLSILELPAFNARVLMSFGLIPFFICVSMLIANIKYFREMLYVIVSVMVIYSFSLCFAYGNGMQKQGEYESQVATMMTMDVNGSGVSKFHILGTVKMSPVTAKIIKNHPYFASLILPYISDKASWRTGIFLNNHFLFDKYAPNNTGVKACSSGASISRGAYEFEVRGDEGVFCFK